jgi:polyisoprenyl-phosphate glycosyltransferase
MTPDSINATTAPLDASEAREAARRAGPIMLSVLVPMYNEAEVVDRFLAEIVPVLERVADRYEIVCVSDGSVDATVPMLMGHRRTNANIRIVELSRNFGKESALSAALDVCQGDVAVPIDADLQDPPEVIEAMIAKWREGADVVYGVRSDRSTDTPLKRMTARGFYWLIGKVSTTNVPADTGDFRLLDRKVIDAMKMLPERNRFMKGLFGWIGFRQVGVPYARAVRVAGTTKFNYWKLWNFAIDGITGFSSAPLRAWTYVGGALSAFAFIYGAFLIVDTMIHGRGVPGYPSLMVAILFIGGVQLISLGVIGEYIARVFQETKRRPLYVIRTAIGFDDADPNLHSGERRL